MDLCVSRAVLERTANQIWKQSIASLKVQLVMHARRARIPRPQVSPVWAIATNARLGKRTHTMVPTAVLLAVIVALIRKQPRKDRSNATLVTTVRRRKKAVRNVSRVVQERLALGVKIVL